MTDLKQPPLFKICSKCGDDKPASEFYRAAHHSDGLRSSCKTCDGKRERNRKQESQEWRDTHPGYFMRWRERNREHVRAYQREYNRTRRKKPALDTPVIILSTPVE